MCRCLHRPADLDLDPDVTRGLELPTGSFFYLIINRLLFHSVFYYLFLSFRIFLSSSFSYFNLHLGLVRDVMRRWGD